MSWSISCERLRRRAVRWSVRSLVLLPRAAGACPKCFGSEPPAVLTTYYLSTLLLSLLPVIIIATLVGVGFAIKRQMELANRTAAKSPS